MALLVRDAGRIEIPSVLSPKPRAHFSTQRVGYVIPFSLQTYVVGFISPLH